MSQWNESSSGAKRCQKNRLGLLLLVVFACSCSHEVPERQARMAANGDSNPEIPILLVQVGTDERLL